MARLENPRARSLLLAILATAAVASAEEPNTLADVPSNGAPVEPGDKTAGFSYSYGVTTSLNSTYVFRGQAYSARPVSQNALWLEAGRFSFYAWNNVLVVEEPLQRRMNEVDFGVAYAQEVGGLTLEAGLDHYAYRTVEPLAEPNTLETSAKATYLLGSVAVFSRPIVDLGSARGAVFLQHGVAHERALGPRVSLSGEASVGWASARYNDAYIGVAKSAFHHAGLELSLEHRITDFLSLTYQLAHTRVLDGELRSALERPDITRFGVSLGLGLD